jgi:hypothetical protein
MVSGTFHSSNRGSFQCSLTVLIAIGRTGLFSLTGWSLRIHTRFHVSGTTWDTLKSLNVFTYGAITLYGHSFQNVLLTLSFVTFW